MDSALRIVNPYANATILHPLTALLLLFLLRRTLVGDRHAVIAALLVVMNLVTSAQRISVASIDFPILRIVILAALARIFIRREYIRFRPNNLDRLIFLQISVTAFAGYLRNPSFSEVTYIVSTVADSLGGYLAVRMLIRDREDMQKAIRTLMWIVFIVAALFVIERLTGRNPMAAFGGVSEYTWIREGKMRIQGPYPHVILAGAFWATIIPLFVSAGTRNGIRQPLMHLATLSGLAIILLCASSTPLMATIAGSGAMLLYYQQNMVGRLKAILATGIAGLALFWKHPVWYLVVKIDFTGGSTGYFRYYLIDSFVRNWKEWFWIGTRTTDGWGFGLIDVCNQYVSAGTNGGFAGFVLFAGYIVLAIRYMGILAEGAIDPDERRDYWFLAVSVIVHLFNFIGVAYFSQITFCWWFTLAICSSLYQAKAPAPSGTGA